MSLIYIVYGYFIVMNLYAFALMGMDKRYAKRRKRRVPEKRFFIIGAIGGAIGVWYGMMMWRHKTQHHAFTTGIPYLVAVNIIAIIVITGLWGMNDRG